MFLEDLIFDLNDSFDVRKYSNQELFNCWKEWCSKTNVKLDLNIIQFGIKISQLMKKTLNINDVVCISKDVKHSKTIINIKELRAYFRKLNKIDFIEDEEEEVA